MGEDRALTQHTVEGREQLFSTNRTCRGGARFRGLGKRRRKMGRYQSFKAIPTKNLNVAGDGFVEVYFRTKMVARGEFGIRFFWL